MLRFVFGDIWYYGMIIGQSSTVHIGVLALMILSVAAVAYLLGNVNTAIIITRLVYKEDIRTKGSGNAGMTNVMRTYGWVPAVFTLLGDMLKCMLSMVVGTLIYGLNGAYIAGLFCVLGHIAPVLYRFKGGKGVASSAMFILYVSPISFGVIALIFVLIVLGTKYLSLASVMCVLMMPLIVNKIESATDLPIDLPLRLIIMLIIAALVVFMHRANIRRIMNKTESKFHFKRTVKKVYIDTENTESDEAFEEEEELTEEVIRRKEINRKKSAKKKK